MAKGGRQKKCVGPDVGVSIIAKAVPPRNEIDRISGDRCPSWRFGLVGKHDIFRFPTDGDTLAWLVKELSHFETKTLSEWRGDRSANRYAVYDISELRGKLHEDVVGLMDKFYRDFNELHRFRLNNKTRVYAITQGNGVFQLLFYDPEHEIYKCEKK